MSEQEPEQEPEQPMPKGEEEMDPESEKVFKQVQNAFGDLWGRPDWPACFWRQFDCAKAKELTPAEIQGIVTFRQRIKDANLLPPKFDDDFTMNKFLRARKYDQDKTFLMWSNYIKWRNEMKVDELYFTEKDRMNAFRPAFKRAYPQGFHQVDNHGHPFYFERIGLLNFPDLIKVGKDNDTLLRYYVWEAEHSIHVRLPCCTVQAGKPINQCFVILDLKGLNSSIVGSQSKAYVKRLSNISQDYYPEGLYRMHIVNAPRFVSGLFNMIVKPLLDSRTQHKINMHSSNGATKIALDMRNDFLPNFLGGDDETCAMLEEGYEDQGPWKDGEPYAPKQVDALYLPGGDQTLGLSK